MSDERHTTQHRSAELCKGSPQDGSSELHERHSSVVNSKYGVCTENNLKSNLLG